MTKGIRSAAINLFAKHLPSRAEIGNTAFRKTVMTELMDMFQCSVASAATHYNHAFQEAKKTMPEQVVGLGRPPEKNNGGRKPVHVVDVVKADGEVVASKISRAAAAALIARAKEAGLGELEVRAVVKVEAQPEAQEAPAVEAQAEAETEAETAADAGADQASE